MRWAPLFFPLLLLAGCSAFYDDKGTWILTVEAPAEEQSLAAARLTEILIRDPAESELSRSGNVITVTLYGEAARQAHKHEDEIVEKLLAPPAGPRWRLEIDNRVVTFEGIRWFERVESGPASRGAESRRGG